ncbi:MAG: hypothetical protein ACOH2R_11460 [Pseudomonas sp.]
MITNARVLWLACTAVSLLAACASQPSQLTRVELAGEGRNTGRIGYVTLIPHDDSTEFNFFVSGVYGHLRPVRLYAFIYPGPCANRGAQPLYALNDQVITMQSPAGWSFNRTANVAVGKLSGVHYSMVVTSGPEEGNAQQFCGDIL